MANEGKSPGTIANAVSTIHTLQALKGYATPDLYDVAIRLQLRGLQNLSDHVKNQAQIMTPQMLLEISKIVNYKDVHQVVCFVALLTGFYLLLRKSNLVPVSMMGKTGFHGSRQLQRQDLRIGTKTIIVDLKWSKTRQKTGKILQLPLLPLVGKEICPIYWLKKMVKLVPGKCDSPLFLTVPVKGTRYVPLTYKRLGDQLKDWVETITGSAKGWTLHGLHRGGATWCFNVDIASEAI